MKSLFISDICPWAPGLYDDKENWTKWAEGQLEINCIKESPKLEYADPLFKRRLSQITRMTIQVVHNLLQKTGCSKDTKLVFISLRGEIEREFTVDKNLIQDGCILPASFSLSVFNTPVSSATLCFGLKGGYSAIYPSKNNFKDGFLTAAAPVLAGTEEQVILVYADELVPEVYGDKRPAENIPMAFACLLSSKKPENGIELVDLQNINSSPIKFLKELLM